MRPKRKVKKRDTNWAWKRTACIVYIIWIHVPQLQPIKNQCNRLWRIVECDDNHGSCCLTNGIVVSRMHDIKASIDVASNWPVGTHRRHLDNSVGFFTSKLAVPTPWPQRPHQEISSSDAICLCCNVASISISKVHIHGYIMLYTSVWLGMYDYYVCTYIYGRTYICALYFIKESYEHLT